jgi:hypothetical protein
MLWPFYHAALAVRKSLIYQWHDSLRLQKGSDEITLCASSSSSLDSNLINERQIL